MLVQLLPPQGACQPSVGLVQSLAEHNPAFNRTVTSSLFL